MLELNNQTINLLLGIIAGLTLLIPSIWEVRKKERSIRWYKKLTPCFYFLILLVGIGIWLTIEKDKIAEKDATAKEKLATLKSDAIIKALNNIGLNWDDTKKQLFKMGMAQPLKGSDTILSEFLALKKLILRKSEPDIKRYINAYILLELESYLPLKKVITQSCGPLVQEIPLLLNYSTFGAYLDAKKVGVTIMNNEEIKAMISLGNTEMIANKYGLMDYWINRIDVWYDNTKGIDDPTFAFVAGGKNYRANQMGDKIVESLFAEFKKALDNPYF